MTWGWAAFGAGVAAVGFAAGAITWLLVSVGKGRSDFERAMALVRHPSRGRVCPVCTEWVVGPMVEHVHGELS